MLGFLQKIGKAFMLPVAALPVAGLMLRLGAEDVLDIPFIAAAGDAVIGNLALLFAIGVAVGLAKDGHGAAGLAGMIGYFVVTQGAQTFNETINMGVLGGILSGVIAGLLYNRYHDIRLPDYLGFFGGRRFVPIVTSFAMLILAIIFGFIWPVIQNGLDALGYWIIEAGAVGAGIFGFLNRLLIPLGLHHVLNSIVWFIFGEYNGATGDLWRFFAGDPTAGVFMTGFFPVMMFGLPAACLAMILTAKKSRRKVVAGLLFSLAFTSFLTGITEPVEFAFLFLSPLLYVVHALLTGISMSVAYILGIKHGFAFSAGAIDFFLNFGLATKPLLLLGVGLIYGVIYFVVFYFLIKTLNLKTPGREDDEKVEEGAQGEDKYEALAARYLAALGGADNIATLDNCITRLRLDVKDMGKVDEALLKEIGAKGVLKLGATQLQVIVGTEVEYIATEMRKLR